MQDEALEYLDKSDGWEVEVGPRLVVVDKGFAGSMSTTTAKDDIYAFFFDQKGLMAWLGLKGSKILGFILTKESPIPQGDAFFLI